MWWSPAYYLKYLLQKDTRKTIDLTTFGFIQGGFLQVNVSGFISEPVPLQQANGNVRITKLSTCIFLWHTDGPANRDKFMHKLCLFVILVKLTDMSLLN